MELSKLGRTVNEAYEVMQTLSTIPEEGPTHYASDNIFGTLGAGILPVSTSMGFIPIDGEGGTFNLLGQDNNPIWLGLETKQMQWWAYRLCSPLSAVIDRLAIAGSNGKVTITSMETGKTTQSPAAKRLQKLMARPNPVRTWYEFNLEQDTFANIFGYVPVFCVYPEGMNRTYATSMYNLNPFLCYPQINYNYDMYAKEGEENSNPIAYWRITLFGKSYDIPSEYIMLIKDGLVDNTTPQLGLPLSKVAGLDFFVSNICASMEADNVLLKKKGPLGVWSYDSKPDQMAGQRPMKEDDKKELQKDLSKYGLVTDKNQHVISRNPIKWNATSFNIKDLATKETIRQGIDGICDRFGYPAELMSGKNATYENRSSAEKFLYQNNIIPFSLRKMESYKFYFGLYDLGLDMDICYDHLPVLQEDIQKASQASKAEEEALSVAWKDGMITWNERRIKRGYEPVSGMDIYYPDYLIKYNLQPATESVTV